jgi:hypothetical protein
MSDKHVSPAMHIARKHQSAPTTHWVDGELKKAAVEIDEGRWIEDPNGESSLDDLGLALGFGESRVALGQQPMLKDFQATRDINQLGRHPRVIEALAKLREEVDTTSNPQEAIEKAWAIHEMNEAQAEKNKWEGQDRWQGKDNLNMRMQGENLTPQDFHARLCAVIGRERVLLSPHAVKTTPTAKSGRVGLYIHNPRWQGDALVKPMYAQQKAAEFKAAAEREVVAAKRLRAASQNALADQAFNRAADMIQAASELLHENMADAQLREPQLLRVGTLQWPMGTEWMVMNFDEYGVPTTARYLGWRTALLTMVRAGCISEKEAHEAFPVASGPAGDWYLEQLWMRRNLEGHEVTDKVQ